MAFTAQYGAFNVEASFNDFFRKNITGGQGLPTWINTAYFSASGVNFNYPEKQLTYPCYSITPLSLLDAPFSPAGGRGGSALRVKYLMVDVSCWASRRTTAVGLNASVRRDVLQLRDMAVSIMESAKNYIPILDYYSEGLTATTVLGSLRLNRVEEVNMPPDVDPAVRRRRLVATYNFAELWSPN